MEATDGNKFNSYQISLFQCSWPQDIVPYKPHDPVKALILADTHLLGPYRGHWLDKLRREWQMRRSFQTAMALFQPQLVIFLGDLFDEGQWVTDTEWKEYVRRFHRLFHTPDHVKVVAVVGNHDIGFHYVAHPRLVQRFEMEFRTTGVELFTIQGVHFVAINSVAMQGDGCQLCETAEDELKNISSEFRQTPILFHSGFNRILLGILKCSRGIGKNCRSVPKIERHSPPIILQHYPMYRESDDDCIENDTPKIEKYRESWDVLSQESTDFIGELLEPRLAFSGHSHNYCLIKNRLNIEEYTIPSFSCRNRDNPAFALVSVQLFFTSFRCSIF